MTRGDTQPCGKVDANPAGWQEPAIGKPHMRFALGRRQTRPHGGHDVAGRLAGRL